MDRLGIVRDKRAATATAATPAPVPNQAVFPEPEPSTSGYVRPLRAAAKAATGNLAVDLTTDDDLDTTTTTTDLTTEDDEEVTIFAFARMKVDLCAHMRLILYSF